MKKFLIVSVIVLLALIVGAFIYARYADLSNTPQPKVGGLAGSDLKLSKQNLQPADQLTLEKQGIQVTVESVERVGGQTIVRLAMDNHAYDLNEFDVKGVSSLDGVSASDYGVLGDQIGGHHLEADLIFPGELFGRLVVGMKEGLLFEFDL